jgi:uncharacterized membrane protein
MTDTSHRRTRPAHDQAEEHTGWLGWVLFAAVMLMLMGALAVIQGLVALFDDGFYLVGQSGLVLDVDYDVWGWAHLLLGIVAVLSGLGLMTGNLAARMVGVAVAFLSALANMAFIGAYPVWSTIIIAIDVLVIYAIVAHGRELKSDYR